MVARVTPLQAQELLSHGDVEVIDVREPAEWAEGHVPGARLVTLADLRAKPEEYLRRDNILFVCAGGVRSQTAARIADLHGLEHVYSLSGGTLSWIKAGLPLSAPLSVAV